MITSFFIPVFASAEGPPIDDTLAPLTLTEAKRWLHVDSDDEDEDIADLVRAAARWIAGQFGIVSRDTTIVRSFNGFADRLPLYRAPLNSVTRVAYLDSDGAEVELATDQYRVAAYLGNPVVAVRPGLSWPYAAIGDGTVSVTIRAGYLSNADIPAEVKQAARMLIGHWYRNREAVGTVGEVLQLGVRSLLDDLRLSDV